MIPCYVFITRSWIISPRAKRLYLICAILTAVMLVTIIALQTAMILADTLVEQSLVVRTLAFLILISGIFGTATLWVAMWYHWYGYNRGGLLSKSFWFLSLLFFGPLAAIFYYFFPYRWSFRSILET